MEGASLDIEGPHFGGGDTLARPIPSVIEATGDAQALGRGRARDELHDRFMAHRASSRR